jgi:hypothetical protein
MTDVSSLIPGFYERSHEYRLSHTDAEAQAMDIMRTFRGRKKGQVKVYRAIPADVEVARGKGINAGDWVTPVRSYAVEHGRSHLSNQFRIVSKTVPPRHLFTEANSWEEWGYDPTVG